MCGAADCAPPRAGLPERGAGAAAGMWEMQPRGREGCAQAAILCLNARENSLSPRMAAARGPSAALWAYVAAGRQGAGVSGPKRNPDCEKLLMKILKRVENHMKK